PEAYGAFAFAAMELILDTIEQVGPDRKAVRDALGDVKDRESIIGKITFDDHGQNTVPLITRYVVQDGKWVLWEDSEYAARKRKLAGQKYLLRRPEERAKRASKDGCARHPSRLGASRLAPQDNGTFQGQDSNGRGAACPIRHERAHARHDVCLGGGGIHAVLRRARRHQVLPRRRTHGRRVHRARDLPRPAGGGAWLALARARGNASRRRAADGVPARAYRPLYGAAAAPPARAKSPARHSHARHGAARSGAAVLSRRCQPQAVPGAAAGKCGELRAFHAASRQCAHARGGGAGHR